METCSESQCPHLGPTSTRVVWLHLAECKDRKTGRRMAGEFQVSRIPGLLTVKMIWKLFRLIDSHTSSARTSRRGWRDEVEPNSADLRVDHTTRAGYWALIRTSLTPMLNWLPASAETSLPLTWQRTSTSQQTRERSRVHWRRTSCLKSNACLLSSFNNAFLLLTRMTLVGIKRPILRDNCSFKISTELSTNQMFRQQPISSKWPPNVTNDPSYLTVLQQQDASQQ